MVVRSSEGGSGAVVGILREDLGESEHEGEGEDEGEGWVEDDTAPQEMEFTAVPGFRHAMPTTPLGFIQLFITSELLMYVVEETNKYAEYCREVLKRPHAKLWTGCNLKDLANYLCLSMLMGIICMPSLRMY